jgi:hypothetical protein
VARAIVTSVVREAGLYERSGFVRVVDLEQRAVLACWTMPESRRRALDPNPRGGLRGAKGVGVHGERLVVANVERVFVLDSGWRPRAEVTHPWLSGIHDLSCGPDGILVTSANCDLLLRVGWDGSVDEEWTWRRDRELAAELGLPSPPAFEPELDYRDPVVLHTGLHNLVHLNGVARGRDGVLVTLGRILAPPAVRRRRARAAAARLVARTPAGRAAVAALRRRRRRRLTVDARWPVERMPGSSFALVALGARPRVLLRRTNLTVPNHNVHEEDGLLVYNDSNASRVVAVDRDSGRERHAAPVPGSPAFARGLASLGDGRFLVGSQAPAALHTIDLAGGRVLESLDLGGHERETVYAVSLLPPWFDDPPAQVDWTGP